MAFVLFSLIGLLLLGVIGLLLKTLRRLATCLAASALAGLTIGLVAAFFFESSFVPAALVGGFLALPFLLRIKSSRPRPMPIVLVQNHEAQPGVTPLSYRFSAQLHGDRTRWWNPKRKNDDRVLENAWIALSEHAPFAQTRVSLAKQTCAQLLKRFDEEPLNGQLSDWALVVRKHVPLLVEKCFDECRRATVSDRRELLENLVISVQKIAAEAEQRINSRTVGSATDFDLVRKHIDNRVGSGLAGSW